MSGSSFTFAPVTEIKVDSRADRAGVMSHVQCVVAENNKAYTE